MILQSLGSEIVVGLRRLVVGWAREAGVGVVRVLGENNRSTRIGIGGLGFVRGIWNSYLVKWRRL